MMHELKKAKEIGLLGKLFVLAGLHATSISAPYTSLKNPVDSLWKEKDEC